METIITHFKATAKAWVAAILPVIVVIFADIGTGAEIDLAAYVATIGYATASWFAVYLKANIPPTPVAAEV